MPGLGRRMPMKRYEDSQRGDRLPVTPRDERVGSLLTRIWAAAYNLRRMGTDSIQPSRRPAVTKRDERVGSRLTRIWAGLYTRPRMGTDAMQPSRRLPTTDYRLPNRATASRSAPVLTAAPSIRAAHSRACGGGPRRPQPPPVYINRRCRDFRREGHICARPRGCKMILKEPHARAA